MINESTQQTDLWKSLAAFQQECPVIHKGTKGYGYSYSDLPSIFKVINPLLKKHNLGFTQLINGTTISTVLFHTKTGQTLTSDTHIPKDVSLKGMNDFQVMGSAVTYIRRYALSSILGIVTDIDNDAHGEQKPKRKPTLSKDRFAKAMNKLESGELSRDLFLQMVTDYELTDMQKSALKTL
ncbi:MAG: putative essential recombination function protein [Prokaryotic dsDNA virus sp.]|nr:MAG: putative essential recombination function protein [Prokaryotic dsDNA virus sp.]|tara:strand:- start:239 stop:781 length:543 start_codon:yes stop_codon:yes gene_type:complete